MKPKSKMNLIIVGYCVFLWLSNWSVSHTYDRKNGLSASSVDLRPLGILIGIIASYIFARRLWKVFRSYLDRSVRVPLDRRIWGGWTLLLLLLPLCVSYSSQSSGFAEDGVSMTTVFEYGGEVSAYAAVCSGLAIMLFQAVVRLESVEPIKLV